MREWEGREGRRERFELGRGREVTDEEWREKVGRIG